MAKVLIFLGILLLIIGIALMIFPNLLSWFGKLPGDIRYNANNTRVYFPIVSMIIISIVVSILINLFRR